MKQLILFVFIFLILPVQTFALELETPLAPDSASALMPENTESFSDGLQELFQNVLLTLLPNLHDALRISAVVIGILMTCSALHHVKGSIQNITTIAGAVAVTSILLNNTNVLIQLSISTIRDMSEYGKLLFPVLMTALIGQGGPATSAALYSGTVAFNLILTNLISKILVPAVYIYLSLAIANSTAGEDILKKLRDMVRSIISWILKTLLTVFTTYMSITGVVSGTTDAAALKATKLTLSTTVPVVGGILSDASDAILISAGLVKNSAGIYGILAFIAVFVGPFLKIWVHSAIMRLTAAICALFGCRQLTTLIEDFSSSMSLLLAMTGAMCLLQLISCICFLKGVS